MSDLFILVGSFCGMENYQLIKSYFKKNLTVSNSEYERILFNGFLKINTKAMMLSAPSVGKFPFSCKRPFTKFLSKDKNIYIANYCTLLGLERDSKYRSLKKAFMRIYHAHRDERITVIGCEAHMPYLKLLKHCKTKLNLSTSLIIPDLPENISSSNNFVYRLAKKLETSNIYKIANNYIDTFLFFTKEMALKFKTRNNYIIREGAIEKFIEGDKQISSRVNCTYVGKTDEENGVLLIYEAAKKLSHIDFEVYGSGNMDTFLFSNKLPNLHYHGFLDPQQVNKKLMEADILLSPRLPKNYTCYSFPSKLLKYVSFCKPVITFKLPCYPELFEECLIYPKDLSVDSFCECISTVANNISLFNKNNVIQICRYLLADRVATDYTSLMSSTYEKTALNKN